VSRKPKVIDPWRIVDDYKRSRKHIVVSVQALLAQGVGTADIAERMGVTRQAVLQIAKRGKVTP
jgi:AcrR family transcriptional regulator